MKQTFLADKLGEKVGHDRLTVIDDGLMPGVIGAKPFDREGVPTRKTTVIEKGVLKSYLLDTYSARKLEMKSTGNASGPNNLYLEAGPTPPETIIQSVKKGLLLTGTIGFGLVPTTGDISRGAFGMWIDNGQIAYPVLSHIHEGGGQRLQIRSDADTAWSTFCFSTTGFIVSDDSGLS